MISVILHGTLVVPQVQGSQVSNNERQPLVVSCLPVMGACPWKALPTVAVRLPLQEFAQLAGLHLGDAVLCPCKLARYWAPKPSLLRSCTVEAAAAAAAAQLEQTQMQADTTPGCCLVALYTFSALCCCSTREQLKLGQSMSSSSSCMS